MVKSLNTIRELTDKGTWYRNGPFMAMSWSVTMPLNFTMRPSYKITSKFLGMR